MRNRVFILGLLLFVGSLFGETERWWPEQKVPKGIVRTIDLDDFELVTDSQGRKVGASNAANEGPTHMLAQSIAGLAAKAVNEGRLDELVWIQVNKGAYPTLYNAMIKRLSAEERGTFTTWQLVERYQKKGIIKGYILYKFDMSEGNQLPGVREGSDHSVNAATTLAGVLQGVMICEEQEAHAKKLGLKMLADVRGKKSAFVYKEYHDKLCRDMILGQDPKVPNNRAIAVANNMITIFSSDKDTEEIYSWLSPLSTIIGWNAGGEGDMVGMISRFGHMFCPTDWGLNLVTLSAGSKGTGLTNSFKKYDPRGIDFDDRSSAVSFVMSDGDNVQWMLNDFMTRGDYWNSKDSGKFPMGWPLPFADLAQMAPDSINMLTDSQPKDTGIALHTGYYYPDLLGAELSPDQRKTVLRKMAKRAEAYLNDTGSSIYTFLCMDIDSSAAMEAYKIYAEEIDGLSGMIVVQYAPYEAGNGEVYWVKNKEGIEIPVITCSYAIWGHVKNPGSGRPEEVAAKINDRVKAQKEGEPFYGWSIIHAWSGFRKTGDRIEAVGFREKGSRTGVTPTKWCVDLLDKDINVVTPDEMIWRIRMKYNPDQTRSLLGLKSPVALKPLEIKPGSDEEKGFMYINGRSQTGGNLRFADGGASWVYRFKFNDPDNACARHEVRRRLFKTVYFPIPNYLII